MATIGLEPEILPKKKEGYLKELYYSTNKTLSSATLCDQTMHVSKNVLCPSVAKISLSIYSYTLRLRLNYTNTGTRLKITSRHCTDKKSQGCLPHEFPNQPSSK
jgi:hypothetical protein